MEEYIACFACGAKSLNIEGECHKYMLSAPGCWDMFCEVMDKEFSDLRYSRAHQLTVDAYAAQHIGSQDDKRAVNSVNIHLASLYCIFELKINQAKAPNFRAEFAQFYKGKDILPILIPPKSLGELTIFEVWDNEDPNLHYGLAEKWASSVWQAWSHEHARIAKLVKAVIE